MAPSQSPLTTIGRKRARPTTPRGRSLLRDDVLQLIQTTKLPIVAQLQHLESVYDAAWRAFCQTTHCENRDSNGVSTDSFTAAWGKLQQLVRSDSVLSDSLVQKIAYAVCASSCRNRHPRLLLEWIWCGHMDANGSLWRFEDVMVRIASIAGEDTFNEWLRASVCSLVSGSDKTTTARLSGRAIIAYLVRIAFTSSDPSTNSTTDSGSMNDLAGVSLAVDAASLARHTLAHLCTPHQVNTTPPKVLALVSDVVANCMADHKNDAAITAALQAFLRAQVKRLLISVASSQDKDPLHFHHAVVDHILTTFQSCVSAANAVQLFRQVWTEVSAQANHNTTRLDAVESLSALLADCATRDGSFKSHALATAHDFAHDAITASNALLLRQSLVLAAAVTTTTTTIATENADDGSTTTTEDDAAAYHEWLRGHFASADTPITMAHSASSDKSRLSISNSPLAMSSWGCLRAPAATTPSSGGDGTGNSTMCGLISTKRHLQFVCAFLLEFDRVGFVGRKAHHVLAHLSAIKTHQTLSGSAVAGLLSDFCSQTRARFAELQATEQQNRARLRRRSSSSASSLKASTADAASTASQLALSVPSSQYTSATRSIVEELLELHAKDVAGLVSQVNQWKLFKKQQWRQQILPCCLDLAYWQSVGQLPGASGGDVQDTKRITEHVRFVQVLAKHHAVGTQEYVAFIDQVETWFKTQQLAADKQSELSSNRHHQKPHPHQSIDTSVAMLSEAVASYFSQVSTTLASAVRSSDQQWGLVADAFVVAFEGLVGLRPSEQDAQMLAIWELIVGRCSAQATAQEGGSLPLDACVEQHLALWFTLLSRDTAGGASAEERHHVMESYCRVAVQQASEKKDPVASPMETLVAIALTGSLVGLLASLTMCESIAVASSHVMSAHLLPSTTTTSENPVDMADLKPASAFLSGFLAGFMKNPTDNAPQMVLQSVLPASLRECLVWLGHFTRTWWTGDLSEQQQQRQQPPHSTRSFWGFVARTNHAVYDQHAWFRLTFSPGVLTSKSQWRVFFERELSCCARELLAATAEALLVDIVTFVNVQREQIDHLLFSSSAGLEARVHVADICTWISKVVLDLANTLPLSTLSPRGHGAAAAMDALVWLLKEIATMQPQASRQLQSTTVEQDDPLEFMLETVSRSVGSHSSTSARVFLVNYGLRCAQVILDANVGSRVAPHVIKGFVDRVARAMDEMPATAVPFEWIRSLWTLLTRLQQSADVFPSATHVPSFIFAHWAFEFARLCRFLPPKKNGKTPTSAVHLQLLKAVQTCYEFYRTLCVRRLAAPTSSLSVVGLSASQYVPSSAIEESLPLHVRSLEWLLAWELLPTPTLTLPDMATLTIPDLKISLVFHETATRVLAALLEDLALDRPDDVAMELTETCQASWMSSVSTATSTHGRHAQSSFKYQLVLVHMVSELAARHASVGRFLLRSSSELLEDPQRGFFVFLVLFASSETEQIDSVLAHNGSLWVNTFAEVACALADFGKEPSNHHHQRIVAILQSSLGFQNQLVGVVARVLSFAVSRQIDLLDSTVLGRMETLFPSVQDLLGRVPVLNLASDAFSLGDF